MTKEEIKTEIDAYLKYRQSKHDELMSKIRGLKTKIYSKTAPDPYSVYADVHIVELCEAFMDYEYAIEPIDNRLKHLVKMYFAKLESGDE